MLELLIVSALISIMLVVSVPAFRNTLITDPLKKSARQVIGMIKEARQLAAVSEKGCFLEVDIEAGEFALSCPITPEKEAEKKREGVGEPVKTLKLAGEVKISSVWDGAGEQFSTGKATLWINSRGLMEAAIINLSDGDAELGLVGTPFLSDIRLADQALVPDDNGS